MKMREKLLIDLINCDEVTKTEMRVAIFCRKQKTLEKISKNFNLSTQNASRICSKLSKLKILIAKKVPGELKTFELNFDWKPDHVENQMTLEDFD